MKAQNIFRRAVCGAVCVLMLSQQLFMTAEAALPKTITLEQVQRMAVSASDDITKKYNEILLKKMKYKESVDGAKAKAKNKKTFRWSPLLSFKFPQQLNMTEQYELDVKPLTLQTEIRNLQHAYNDLRYEAIKNATLLYLGIYTAQEKEAFTSELLDSAKKTLARNEANLASGKATQADIDAMTKKVENLTTEVANLKKELQTDKEKLSDMIDLDVTGGYIFRSALKSLEVPREMLDQIIEYTLDNDQTFYEAKASASTALMNLEAYESLMKSQYGSKMSCIQPYIDMAKKGQEVDYAAFQIQYKQFLKNIDAFWNRKFRILFFSFSMEFLKGEIDGSRYIEDEMYAVYTACMDYATAKKERDKTEQSIRTQVRDSFETLSNTWRSYEDLAKQSENMRSRSEKTLQLNSIGKATYDEVSDAAESYEDIQMECLDTLSTYSELLFSFDRLTCGAVTKYMNGESISLDSSQGGDSLVDIDPIYDPYYYISTSVADLVFSIGVSLPEDFEPEISDFEVWNEGFQIGKRTAIGQEVRHLTLDYSGTSKLTLRFYSGDDFVTECEIDASISRDRLPLESQKEPEPIKEVIGSYKAEPVQIGSIKKSVLSITLKPTQQAKSYSLSFGDKEVFTTEKTPISKSFSYLDLLITSLEDVELELYDRNGELLKTARFDTTEGTVYILR